MTEQTYDTFFDLMQIMGSKATSASTQTEHAQKATNNVALLSLMGLQNFPSGAPETTCFGIDAASPKNGILRCMGNSN